jgi:hypothetical protein
MRKWMSAITLVFLAILHAEAVVAQLDSRGAASKPPSTPTAFQADTAGLTSPTWTSRLVTGMVTAVLGAGVGYFASQVATSDWDETRGRSSANRTRWAALGGAGGFALGFSIPGFGRAPGAGSGSPLGQDRFIIMGSEIREASVGNAMEAVRLFHPEWLVLRGQEDFYDPEGDNIRVYLDEIRIGGIDDLAGIDANTIDYIRFFDSQRATARWGTGHPHGAIQIVTMDR